MLLLKLEMSKIEEKLHLDEIRPTLLEIKSTKNLKRNYKI